MDATPDQVAEAILHRFDSFEVTPETLDQLAASRSTFRLVAKYILDHTPPGREQSTALTALEEAKYFTNQAIALNGATNA